MALILAVDSAHRVEEVRRALVEHEVASVDRCADADGVIPRVPDLVLLADSVPRADASALLSRLRQRAGGLDVATLAIPAAAQDSSWDARGFADRVQQELYAPVVDAAQALVAWTRERRAVWAGTATETALAPEAPTVALDLELPKALEQGSPEPRLGPLVASAGREIASNLGEGVLVAGRSIGSLARTIGLPLLKWGPRAAAAVLVLALAGGSVLVGRRYAVQWLEAWRNRPAATATAPARTPSKAPAPHQAAASTRAPAPAPAVPAVPAADVEPTAGWVRVFAPFEVTAIDRGRPLRIDDSSEIMLAPGSYELHFRNTRFGFDEVQQVTVKPGETSRLTIVPPKSSISISASVPADVWIDGQRVGQTPIIDLPVALGTREIVLKNADGVERRQVVPITVTPVAVDVDFSQQ